MKIARDIKRRRMREEYKRNQVTRIEAKRRLAAGKRDEVIGSGIIKRDDKKRRERKQRDLCTNSKSLITKWEDINGR